MKWSAVFALHVQVTFTKPHFSVSFFFISLLMLPDWHILPRSSPPSATLLSHLSLKLRHTDFRQISVVHGDKRNLSSCRCLSASSSFSPSSVPQHDSQWSPSPCTVCVCSRGSVSCHAHPCPPLTCPGPQSLFTPAGECCPRCGRNGGEGDLVYLNIWISDTAAF